MLQQRQSVRSALQVPSDIVASPVEDFGSNFEAARHIGAAPTEDTPTLGAFEPDWAIAGDSHEHDEIGGRQVVEVRGVELTLGQVNAMADYVGSVEALYELDEATLLALRDAMERHAASPEAVGSDEIGAIVGEGYEELALDNGGHFAGENVATWHQHHATALGLASQAFERDDAELADRARVTDAFGAHFLTDAFSAGHLFEKQPVMDDVTAALGPAERAALVAVVATGVHARCGDTIDDYELVGGLPITAPAFVGLVEVADQVRPELLPNSVVRAAHDHLGAMGVQVVNDHHEPWTMRGDHAMDEVSVEMASQACHASAEAIEGVLAAGCGGSGVAEVLSYVPRPTDDGQAFVDDVLEHLTDPAGGMALGLIGAMSEEIEAIMETLVDETHGGVRRRAGEEGSYGPA